MLRTRHMHLEWEIVKWIALLTLAAALAMAFASQASGQVIQTDYRPHLLPPNMEERSEPMGSGLTEQKNGETVVDNEAVAMNLKIWEILEHHRKGDVEQVIAGWHEIKLPAETDIWRHTSLAMAYLQTGQLDKAADSLDRASQLGPENSVVHYYLGILRMEQARHADEWYDIQRPKDNWLVSYKPPQICPNTRSMYQLAAMTELEQAIANASYIQWNAALVPLDWEMFYQSMFTRSGGPINPVIVSDVIDALGADNFVGKSHNLLGSLYLEQGWVIKAERQVDKATETGLISVFGYSDIGDAYESDGRHVDAVRAYLKSMKEEGSSGATAEKVLKSFKRSLIDLW